MNLIEDLRARNLVHDIMPGTEEQLAKEMTSERMAYSSAVLITAIAVFSDRPSPELRMASKITDIRAIVCL